MSAPDARPRTRVSWLRSYVIAGAALLLGGVAARAASAYIDLRFADRPTPRDLLFELLPNVSWMQYVTDGTLVVGLVLLTWYGLRKRPHEAPGMIAQVGVMQVCRATINILTPLSSPLGNGTYWGLVRYVQNGMFSSGHAATALLFYLFIDGEEAQRLKVLMGGLAIVESAALILARGHYSIDVVGGLLLAYVLHGVWVGGTGLGWLKRWVTP